MFSETLYGNNYEASLAQARGEEAQAYANYVYMLQGQLDILAGEESAL